MILRAVDNFARAYRANKVSYSTLGKSLAWISNFYSYTRGLDTNTRVVKKIRDLTQKDPETAQTKRWNDSFHEGELFEALARHTRTPQFLAWSEARKCVFHRTKAESILGADACARSADLAGFRYNDTGLAFEDKKGLVLPLGDLGDAASLQKAWGNIRSRTVGMKVAFYNTKVNKGRYEERIHLNRPSFTSSVINKAKDKDLVNALIHYFEASLPYRMEMHEYERDFVFVSSTKCRRNSHSKRTNGAGKVVHPPTQCGGKCGKYHPMSPQAIAQDRVWAMKLAGIDPKFTGHAGRGNAEMCIIHGARFSNRFTRDEARFRARHTQETQDKYYARPPHSQWMAAVQKIPEAKRQRMLPEEFLRVR